jgi:ribosomal protein S18 acetylase RimI-like enzyme
MTSIARVTAADLSELVPLMEAYCRFYETAPRREDLTALSEALLSAPDSEGVQLLARDDSGRAIGFATMYWSWDTTEALRTAIMHDLYVDEAVRGGGVGRALIDACCAEAARRGKRRLDWQTAPDNARAQRLYDSTPAGRSTWVCYALPL